MSSPATTQPKLVCFAFDKVIASEDFKLGFSSGSGQYLPVTDPSREGFIKWLQEMNFTKPEHYLHLLADTRETLQKLLAKDGVNVAITSTNPYPELIKLLLGPGYLGLTEQEVAKIYIAPLPSSGIREPKKILGIWTKRAPTPSTEETNNIVWKQKSTMIADAMHHFGMNKENKPLDQIETETLGNIALIDHENIVCARAVPLHINVFPCSHGANTKLYKHLHNLGEWAKISELSSKRDNVNITRPGAADLSVVKRSRHHY